MKWVPCVLKPLIPKYYCVFKQNNDGHLAKMPMFREGHRDRQCLRDGQVNAFQLVLTEGHALAEGNGRDNSQLFKFSLFLFQTHDNELMYINYAYCISLLYMIGDMKNQKYPGVHSTFDD